MTRKDRIEIAETIIAKVKREMDKPRLTASVRETLEAEAARAAKRSVRDSGRHLRD
jgi:hypothetical protein